MNNFFLIEDPITRFDVEYIDDTLDDISNEIADKEAWDSFDDLEEVDPEFEEAWQERSNLEDIVIMKTDIPIEKVRDMSDEELNNILDKIEL
ncbi:hypothetical protein [Megamonas funiformis]|uniref:hypothetical protein n=1 Tax=Megamonas funiformis TaxID=437897 RepID=UPI003F7FC0DF